MAGEAPHHYASQQSLHLYLLPQTPSSNCIKAPVAWSWHTSERQFLQMNTQRGGATMDIYASQLKQGNFLLIFPEKCGITVWVIRCEEKPGGFSFPRDSPGLHMLPSRAFRKICVCLSITHIYPKRFLLHQTRSYNFKGCLQSFLSLHNNDDFDN